MVVMLKDPYQVLGLSNTASETEVKKAYHKLALKYHPDRQENKQDQQQAADKFAEIFEAYDTLTDPVKRYDYRQKQESSKGNSKGNGNTSSRPASWASRGSAPAPPSASPQTPSYHRSPAASPGTYSKTNVRTEFMTRKQESTRSGFSSSPGSLRRKATTGTASPRMSVRSSTIHSSPGYHHRNNNNTRSVQMDGSVRSNNNMQPPMSAPGGKTRRTVGLRTSQMMAPPLSAGANVKRKTVQQRQSTIPQPPLSAGATRTRPGLSSSGPSIRRMPDIPLPVIQSSKGKKYMRQSVRIARANNSPSPRSQSPKRPVSRSKIPTDGSGAFHTGSGPLYPESSSATAPRRNSLDGTGRKKKPAKPGRKTSHDSTLDGTGRKKRPTATATAGNVVTKPRRQVSNENGGGTTTRRTASEGPLGRRRHPPAPVVQQQTVTTTTTTTTTTKKKKGKKGQATPASSQQRKLPSPQRPQRKSIFGGFRSKVQDSDAKSTQTAKKKKKKKKSKDVDTSERSVRSMRSTKTKSRRRTSIPQ